MNALSDYDHEIFYHWQELYSLRSFDNLKLFFWLKNEAFLAT